MSLQVPPAQVHVPAEDRQEILRLIDEALATGQLTLGKIGKELEDRFAELHGAKHAIAVNSGTSSIEIPLKALGVQGKEVLVPANTFFATAAGVIAAGATPRFVDCDPATLAVDPESLKANITANTAGLVVVHIGGLVSPAIKELRSICDEHGLFLFEDAAHAHGSSLGGQFAGTFGFAGSFSFYPTKVITSGEGGMIITDDDTIAEEARTYRDQGKAGFTANVHTRLGYNWRMSEVHAAIGLLQLKRLPEFIAHRQHIAAIYDEGLASLPLTPVHVPAEASCNYYKYIAYLPDGVDRAELKKTLREEFGVGPVGRGLRAAAQQAARLRGVGDRRPAPGRPHLRPPHLPAHLGGHHRRPGCSRTLFPRDSAVAARLKGKHLMSKN